MRLAFINTFTAVLVMTGCDSEPTTLREQAELAQENLAEAREDASDMIAESEEDAVQILADARQEAKEEVGDARREADELVDQAKLKLDAKLEVLQDTESIIEGQPAPSDEAADTPTIPDTPLQSSNGDSPLPNSPD